MAALNAIAREWADELREGIAWVIVWKTGRSWNAEAFWLNCDDDTFELGDLDRTREILEQDPNAVMVNGYYCGHFGEGMTVAELAAGIRWHYENGTNLLKDSDAFPPKPMERPEGYEHMHELMAAEQQKDERQEKWEENALEPGPGFWIWEAGPKVIPGTIYLLENPLDNKNGGDHMSKPYRVCPKCGAHLDHGEPCDCEDRAEREAAQDAADLASQPVFAGEREPVLMPGA